MKARTAFHLMYSMRVLKNSHGNNAEKSILVRGVVCESPQFHKQHEQAKLIRCLVRKASGDFHSQLRSLTGVNCYTQLRSENTDLALAASAGGIKENN